MTLSEQGPATDYQAYDEIVATIQPQRTDDLRPGVAEWIGKRMRFYALWIIEDEPYKDQWAFGVSRTETQKPDFEHPPFAWIPECDLGNVMRL